MFQNNKIEPIVNKLQNVYLFLVCLEIFSFIWELLGSLREYDRIESSKGLEEILIFFINLTLYLGLRFRKKWVVPFALLISAFGVFTTLLFILSPAESSQLILAKIFGVLFLLFYGYQLRFFTKPEVRKFFQSEGLVVF